MLLMLTASAAMFFGCTTPNPHYNPQQPPSASNEPYSLDPRLASYSNQVAQLQAATAPINPYAPLTDYAYKGLFGLAGIISGGVLAWKNRGAVIDTMAAGAVKAGPQAAQAILDHAATVSNAHVATIAAALSDNAGINQTATGAPKT